jgi:signal transduction histidine kinase
MSEASGGGSAERRQEAVAELGCRALAGVDLDALMADAVHAVRESLGATDAYVLELQADGSLVLRAGVGWRDGVVGQAVADPAWAVPATQVIVTRQPVTVDDLDADERFPDASLLREHGVASSLNVPLLGHERPFGVLGTHATTPRAFTDADAAFLQSVANVLAAAFEREGYERRRRDRYMQRAEQMMALGQVAAGVAHELRNPLTSIKGLVQVNLREAEAHGLPAEDLRIIEHEVRRMERTLQTFLDFARPPRLDRRPLDLAEVVDRVTTLVGGRARKQCVELRFARPSWSAVVNGDPDQLQQLVLNLALNALDAMPDGGAVEFDLRDPQDGQVELLVRDEGPGVAAHILPKVFETFVSSKETGVGLGLPVSKRIAEEHGGSLAAYNLPTGGACFVLRLPAG